MVTPRTTFARRALRTTFARRAPQTTFGPAIGRHLVIPGPTVTPRTPAATPVAGSIVASNCNGGCRPLYCELVRQQGCGRGMSEPNSRPESPQPGVRRLSVTHFLIALIVLLSIVPFVDQLSYGPLIEGVLLTLVLLAAVMAVGGRKRTLIIALILVTPAVVGRWVDHFQPGLIHRDFAVISALVFIAFVMLHLFRFILRAPRVTDEILHAAIAAYLLLGVLWTFAYLVLSRQHPSSFAIWSPPV